MQHSHTNPYLFPTCISWSRLSVPAHAARRPSKRPAPAADVTLALLRDEDEGSAGSSVWVWAAVQKKCSWKPPVWVTYVWDDVRLHQPALSPTESKSPSPHTHAPAESRPSLGSTLRQRFNKNCKCRPTFAPGEKVRIISGPLCVSSSGLVVGAAVGLAVGAGVEAVVGA